MSKTRDERRETREKQLLKSSNSACHCEERSDAAIQNDFKMTEVGMIPWDWEAKTLTNVANTASGGTPSRSNESFYKGSIKWFTTTELKDCELYDSFEHISEAAIECSSAKVFPKNTLLMAMYGATIGKLGLLKCDAATNQACCAIFPKKADVLYLYYFLLYNRDNIIAMGCGAGQPNVSQDIVKKINIPLPPTIEEQQRIANALSDVDTLISNLEKLIAKKKNIKQGAMRQLLTGRKRLPGFGPSCHPERSTKCAVEGSSHFKMTELGPIPSDWDVKKIGEFTKLQAGGTPSTLHDEFWDGEIRWMNSGELNKKRVYDVAGRITELGLSSSSTHLIPANCVLVGLAGQGKTRGTAAINYVELCTNQSIAAIFPSKLHNSEYLYHNVDCRYDELRELSSGDGGRGGLNLGILGNLYAALPSLKEQTAIANVLSDMDSEIQTLETKLAKYHKLKTGMMQQLLTGKIRLI